MAEAKVIRLARHPLDVVTTEHFVAGAEALPPLRDTQVLVRVEWLSLDPFIRWRLTPGRFFGPTLAVGDVVVGNAIGVVEESRSPTLPTGTRVAGPFGWRDRAVVDAMAAQTLEPVDVPPSLHLGLLGLPGLTAYVGLFQVGHPRPPTTMLVSAATGAVGGLVGQIGRILGCRVVGIAGGPAKCIHAVDQLGFDACLDHRAPDLAGRLAAAAPEKIDLFFDNVGGPVLDAALLRLGVGARVVLCGMIADYDRATPYGLHNLMHALFARAELKAFRYLDHAATFPAARAQLATWWRDGKLHTDEQVANGLDSAPAAFVGMLGGANLGKQLVRVAI